MNLNGCRILRAISFCALLTGSAASSRAEIIYGVDASQLLSVDSTTGLTTRLFDLSTWAPGGTAWTGDANALAYDAYAQNLIFSEVNGSRIGIYNTSTLTASVLADLDMFGSVTSVVIGGTVDGNMGGGAFFYNDSYYFTVEDVDGGGAQHSRMFRANLNASHTAFTSVGLITFGGDNPWLGDFGDLAAINNGTVYGSTVRTDTSLGVLYGLWSFNIENPDSRFHHHQRRHAALPARVLRRWRHAFRHSVPLGQLWNHQSGHRRLHRHRHALG